MTSRLGSLLVLTEDQGNDAHATVTEVVKRMLRLAVPGYQTHRLNFEPRDKEAQQAIRGARWKSTDARDQQALTELFRTITTRLLRGDGFVFFHVDGDRPWSQRETSENVAKFTEIVRARVHQNMLYARRSPEEAERHLQRLFLIAPFYSIEAWAYQNTEVAVRLCNALHQGRDVERFEAWKLDRAALDEVVNPKKETCLRAGHNLELVGAGYPADEVFNAERSYGQCVLDLLNSVELMELLEKTKVLLIYRMDRSCSSRGPAREGERGKRPAMRRMSAAWGCWGKRRRKRWARPRASSCWPRRSIERMATTSRSA
jgi:hypothetical protein